MLQLESHPRGVILPVRAHAGARQNAILGVREGALRVAVTATAEKGKANRAIVAVLNRTLGVSKSDLELIAGETSRRKRFLVVGVKVDQVRQVLAQIVPEERAEE